MRLLACPQGILGSLMSKQAQHVSQKQKHVCVRTVTISNRSPSAKLIISALLTAGEDPGAAGLLALRSLWFLQTPVQWLY